MRNRLEILDFIESKYPINHIEDGNGTNIWPLFRGYITDAVKSGLDKTYESRTRRIKLPKNNVFHVSMSNWRHLDTIVFTKSENIVVDEGLVFDRFIGNFKRNELVIVKGAMSNHLREIENVSVISESYLQLMQIFLFPIFFLPKKAYYTLDKILRDHNVNLNVGLIYRRFKSQEIIASVLLKVLKKLDKIILLDYPAYYGYIKYFQTNGIYVEEVQHGDISEYHSSYNLKRRDVVSLYFPNHIRVFGVYYKNLLANISWYKSEDITIGGSVMLNRMRTSVIEQQYDFTITEQLIYRKVLLGLADTLRQEFNGVYLSREDLNLAQMDGLKVSREYYNFLRQGKCNITVSSSSLYESLYMGIPVIVYDFNGNSRVHFGNTLSYYGVFYCVDLESLVSTLKMVLSVNFDSEKLRNSVLSRYCEEG